MENLKLSIVVPVYNVERYLSRCLESLLNQKLTEEDYEIIIVNDGTKDNSMSIVNDFALQHKNIVVFEQENKGLSGARNTGVNIAKGKYIYFIDSDDYVAANTLHKVLSIIEKNNLDLLGFSTQTTESLTLEQTETDVSNLDDIHIQNGLDYMATHNYMNNVWWYFIRRDFLLDTGITFIEGVMLEDGIYTAELFSKAKRMSYTPIDIYRYVQHNSSIMHNKSEAHYNKLIEDFEHIIFKFSDLVHSIQQKHPEHPSLRRLSARKESYVFFLIARIVQSNLPFHYLEAVLDRFKKIDVYPISKFISEDNNGLQFKILTFIFNRRTLLRIFMFFFRIIKR